MKQKLLILALLFLFLLTGCGTDREGSDPDMAASQIEQALPEAYEKQTETEVISFDFSSPESGDMKYYVCVTTYHNDSPATATQLNTNAISAVFDVESAILLREFDAVGHPAAIYQLDTSNYLCWTTNSQVSAVLRYDPNLVSEEEAVKIAESVYQTPSN